MLFDTKRVPHRLEVNKILQSHQLPWSIICVVRNSASSHDKWDRVTFIRMTADRETLMWRSHGRDRVACSTTDYASGSRKHARAHVIRREGWIERELDALSKSTRLAVISRLKRHWSPPGHAVVKRNSFNVVTILPTKETAYVWPVIRRTERSRHGCSAESRRARTVPGWFQSKPVPHDSCALDEHRGIANVRRVL